MLNSVTRGSSLDNISEANERLTVTDGHIDGALTNLYSELVRCFHNLCLKVLHLFRNIVIHNINENRGGRSSTSRILSISKGSLTEGHIVALCTVVVFRVCSQASQEVMKERRE